jgi:single-stranded-DNA-specific exonuclease
VPAQHGGERAPATALPLCTAASGTSNLFRVRQRKTALRRVAWGMADRLDELLSGGRKVCVAAKPKINDWNGYRAVELEVADFQAGATAVLG